VMGGVGIMFISCLGMKCIFVYLLVVGLISQ
jgi:hypothetical protein